jgi:heme exporter protein D
MQFDSMNDFFAMGGYGFYVWLSFGTTFGAMIILVINSVRAERAIKLEIQKQDEREARIRQAEEQTN